MGKFFWAILSQKEQPIYFCQKILVLRLNCPRPWRIKGLVFFMFDLAMRASQIPRRSCFRIRLTTSSMELYRIHQGSNPMKKTKPLILHGRGQLSRSTRIF